MTSPFIIIDEIESALSAVETKIDTIDGIVDTINSRLTATRATYIDNIRSYTVTNNTASSTGTLSQKLSYIINTGTPVTSLSGKIIKSVQRGVISMEGDTATATITSVNTSKAVVVHGWSTLQSLNGSYDYASGWDARLALTNSTTITATRSNVGTSASYVNYQVIEFY